MNNRNSTRRSARSKPAKPYPEFPLFPRATKRWAKKNLRAPPLLRPLGRSDGALQKYLDQKDALYRGLTPADSPAGLTVFSLCAKFLTTKKRMMETGELSVHSYSDYAKVCKRLIKTFSKSRLVVDLRPDDFERLRTTLAKTYGPVRLGNEINRTRIVFNYALKNGLIDKPMVYGEGFRRPSKKTLRQHRAEQGAKMFQADEIRRMAEGAGPALKAMILLGVNCGFGNADVGTLPLSALDLNNSWLNYARPKTGIARRCPLWPETVTALKEWLAVRPMPVGDMQANLVFITAKGDSWAKDTSDNPVSKKLANCSTSSRSTAIGTSTACSTLGKPSVTRPATFSLSATSWATSAPTSQMSTGRRSATSGCAPLPSMSEAGCSRRRHIASTKPTSSSSPRA